MHAKFARRGEAPAPSRDDEVRRNSKLRPNVLANRHFAVGRVWARLLKPKLGPPQSVRLSEWLAVTGNICKERFSCQSVYVSDRFD